MGNLYIRFATIFIAIMLGFLIFKLLIEPMLKNSCFLNTNQCVKISFYKSGGSVLFNVSNSDKWAWFDNGDQVYLFDNSAGEFCTPTWSTFSPKTCKSDSECSRKDANGKEISGKCIDGFCPCSPVGPPYATVFANDIGSETIVPKGYECMQDLQCITHRFKSQNVPLETIFVKPKDVTKFGITDAINVLINREIINKKSNNN